MRLSMFRLVSCLLFAALWASQLDSAEQQAVSVERSESAVEVHLPGSIKLQFALQNGALLGLNRALVDTTDLTSEQTILRPVLADEWSENGWITPSLRLDQIIPKENGSGVILRTSLLGTRDFAYFRKYFVMRGDTKAVLKNDLPEHLTLKQQAHQEAQKRIAQLLAEDPRMAEAEAAQAKREADLAELRAAEKPNNRQIRKLQKAIKAYEKKGRQRIVKSVRSESEAIREQDAISAAWRAALNAYAIEHYPFIHRDFYRFPLLRQPEEIMGLGAVQKDAAQHEQMTVIGQLDWHIVSHQESIAGWPWQGWRMWYEIRLNEGFQSNVVRQLGTWEIGGSAVGLTAVALRYRGLGRIEHSFSEGANGGVAEAFTTTEVIPGHVGSAPAVSPIVPSSASIGDRGYALRHRVGAWIARMARGAGANLIDFQWRGRTTLLSYFAKQGNMRTVSESFPGDSNLSFTDEWYVPLGRELRTEPQIFLTLHNEQPLALNEQRTRWQEADQFVRDTISAELDFRQHEVRPGIGLLSDHSWSKVYEGIRKSSADYWGKQGVGMLAYHNPGWINGRHQGPNGPSDTGGGVCDIYDWTPADDIAPTWEAAYPVLAENKIAYFTWIGQTVRYDQAFVSRVGEDRAMWSLNGPHDTHGPGYGAESRKGNIYHPTFRDEFTRSLEQARKDFGYNGYWIDSFQNLCMSQLAWGDGSGTSLQRGWWEWLAERSRSGVAIMAESHAAPGISCSIEVGGITDPANPYYFHHVFRWMRGTEQTHFEPEQLNTLAFRYAANKAWLAPDISHNHKQLIIPNFSRYAHSYNAAIDSMRRPSVLPQGAGMLWRSFADDNKGIVWSYEDLAVPEGITATDIISAEQVTSFKGLHVYRVQGESLLDAFGVQKPPQADERLGREWQAPAYDWNREHISAK